MITPEQYEQMQVRLTGKGPTKPMVTLEPPVEDENKLHNEIIEFCDANAWPYLHGAMSMRTHRTEGEPDFTILAPEGRSIMVECKTKTGKLTPTQRQFAAFARRNGHPVYLVRNMEQFRIVVSRIPGYESFAIGLAIAQDT